MIDFKLTKAKNVLILFVLIINIGCTNNEKMNSGITIWDLVSGAKKSGEFNLQNFTNSFNQLSEIERDVVVSEYVNIFQNLCERNILLLSLYCYNYDNEIECNVSLEDYILLKGENVYHELFAKPDKFTQYFKFETDVNMNIGIYPVLKEYMNLNQKRIISNCKNMYNKNNQELMNNKFPMFLSKYNEFNEHRYIDCGEFTPINAPTIPAD